MEKEMKEIKTEIKNVMEKREKKERGECKEKRDGKMINAKSKKEK